VANTLSWVSVSHSRTEQVATRHRTRDFVSLWIVDALLKRRRPVPVAGKVTRNFESVLVIYDAPIRLRGSDDGRTEL
jgi:hypothetical protein